MISPLQLAAGSALVTTGIASLIPADRVSDRQSRSWLPSAWKWYRFKLLLLQVAATVVLSAGASRIGWTPADSANGFSAVAQGVSWSVAAVALLRAEFSGLRSGEAAPGFSVLRAISAHLTDELKDDVGEAVRSAIPASLADAKRIAFTCKSRAHAPRPDGTRTPDAKALAAAIELLAEEGNLDELRELTVHTVLRHKLPKCW